MVHLDKSESQQKGSMVLTEDGSILTSSGDLASSESTANTIMALVSHSLQLGDEVGGGNVDAEGNETKKWNRLTVSFGDVAYVACLSNKKIHVVKQISQPEPDQ